MGIFSLFGKKNRSPEHPDEDAAGNSPEGPTYPQVDRRVASRPPPNQIERRVAARATALKIDAIETEMTRDILASAAPTTIVSPAPAPAWSGNSEPLEPAPTALPPEGDTEILADDGVLPLSTIEVSAGGSAQDIEEAAILFASKQYTLAESMLRQALLGESNWRETNRAAWWMLFDLYQVLQRQDDFESLSIDYASLFETSPPGWIDGLYPPQADAAPARPVLMPTIAFAGRLDRNIEQQLQRLQTLGDGQPCRLEFARVTEVAPAGCTLLLAALQKLQKDGHELVLVGAPELVERIRALVKVGRRDETADTWLLLLELLRLLKREKEFEETSIDYCVTFEVSPPQFEQPAPARVSTVAREAAAPDARSDRFLLPGEIEGDCAALWQEVQTYAEQHQPVLIDCSRLARIEFVAAGQLLSLLTPLAARKIEFHGVNHLVAALFNLMGFGGIATIVPHHY